tara:strand:+ start:1687 stop:2121 length:435 start_codon:yes stop_codon:yes gene_type:complete
MRKPQGLMPNSKPKTTTPKLDALRQQFQPKAARSLEDELATMDENQMQSLTTTVKMATAMYNAEDMKSYAAHVDNMYPKQLADRKRLIVRIMKELSPEGEYQGKAKPEPNYANEFYNRLDMQLRPAKQPSAEEQLSFMRKLVQP